MFGLMGNTKVKMWVLAGAVVAGLGLGAGGAQAQVRLQVGVQLWPVVTRYTPTVNAATPLYLPPCPPATGPVVYGTVVAPAPVVYQPPIIVAPAPVYGPGYYADRDRWERERWEREHHDRWDRDRHDHR